MKTYFSSVLLILILANQMGLATASPRDVELAADKLCQKIKQCAFERMKREQGVTSDMRAMVEGMMANMCDSFIKIEDSQRHGDLEDSAIACMDSMSQLSCAEFEANKVQTSACKRYESEIEKHNF